MKYTNKLFGTMLLAVAALTSCVDDDKLQFAYEKPASIAGYEYLNDYDALKTYVNRSASPTFKLGGALAAADYNANGLVTRLANSNFDEVVAGNAMKMASCIGEKGDMDFGTVENFVSSATENGLSVYGHTLAWHAQQPVRWLNSLIKDREMDVDPDAKEEKEVYFIDWSAASSYNMWGQFPESITTGPKIDGGLQVTTTGTIPNFWELQYMVADGITLQGGKEYLLHVEIQGSPESSNLHYVVGAWGNDIKTGVLSFTEDWTVQDIAFSPSDDVSGVHVLFQSGDYQGSYTIKAVQVVSLESPAVEVEKEIHVNTYTDGPFPYYVMGSAPPVINGAIHFEPTGDWSQFFVFPGGDNPLTEGDYVIYLDLTADRDASGYQLTIQNGWGGDAQQISVNFSVKAGHENYKLNFPGVTAIPSPNYDVILKPQTADAIIDLKSVRVCKIEKLNSIPLTDEEKKDTLTWAMDQWISGMMEACNGNVKAWDVVNEAISGGNPDSEGVYALQHGTPENTTDFFWQDYLGDLDYVRTAVSLAREYGPSDIKLFINDYNLESDWDGNNKLKSLIAWIKRWEADGVTKIDGIGSQMHISYYLNPQTLESKKNAIVNSFKLMAESGKLVRISELDMGLVDANGKDVATSDVTEEQHKAMAEYYKWIIQQYLSIIPQAQQWGICQWCLTDSPAGSGWRANSPVGLWDLNYNRKHTYAGFADGLSGK